jgi:hypothetical protein
MMNIDMTKYIWTEDGSQVFVNDWIEVKTNPTTVYCGVLERIYKDAFIIRTDRGVLHMFSIDSNVFIRVIKRGYELTCEQHKNVMSTETFQKLLDELDGNSLQTLKEKNARYSSNGDALHNFRSGAEVAGGTPAQACWGYMTKHLVALRDMVLRDDFSNRDDFLEKCQDTINYVRFLWCIGNETNQNEKESK